MDRLAANLSDCSRSLTLDDAGHVVGRNACRERVCPMCQAARAAEWAGRLHDAMPVIVAEHGARWSFILVTLTVRSVPLAQLREAIRHLHESVDRLAKRAAFGAAGGVRNTEATVNHATGTAHPHCHLLLAVPASYWEGPLREERTARGQRKTVPGYMTHAQWRDLWRDVARLDYRPVVDVRRVQGDLNTKEGRRALYEVTKYGVKPGDMLALAPDQFAVLAAQMKGVRTIGIWGALSTYLRDPDDDGDRIPPYVADVARWDGEARRYVDAGPRVLASERWERTARVIAMAPELRALAARSLRRGGLYAGDYLPPEERPPTTYLVETRPEIGTDAGDGIDPNRWRASTRVDTLADAEAMADVWRYRGHEARITVER